MQTAPRLRAEPAIAERHRYEDPPEDSDDVVYAPGWYAIARGAALFIGMFALLGVFAEMQSPAARVNLWWINFQGLQDAYARAFLGLLATLLVMFAVSPRMSLSRRLLTVLCILAFCAATAWNARDFYKQLGDGRIRVQAAIPFDLHVTALMAVVFAGVLATGWEATRPSRDLAIGGVAFCVCAAAFPIAQMLCFVESADTAPADAVVVLGCLTGLERHEDDRLAERVRTGCECYRQKRAGKVILCGCPGDTSAHEAMQRIVTEMGVPAEAVVLNTEGTDTTSAVASTAKLMESLGCASAIVVSQKFQLARLDLAYRRQGRNVRMLAAHSDKPVKPDATAYAAEAVALWSHYLAPLTGRSAPL